MASIFCACCRAISALRRPSGLSLSESLVLTAREIAEREGGEIRASVAPGVSVPPAAEEALLRIVREATVNAFRHGAAAEERGPVWSIFDLRLGVTGGDPVLDLAENALGQDLL